MVSDDWSSAVRLVPEALPRRFRPPAAWLRVSCAGRLTIVAVLLAGLVPGQQLASLLVVLLVTARLGPRRCLVLLVGAALAAFRAAPDRNAGPPGQLAVGLLPGSGLRVPALRVTSAMAVPGPRIAPWPGPALAVPPLPWTSLPVAVLPVFPLPVFLLPVPLPGTWLTVVLPPVVLLAGTRLAVPVPFGTRLAVAVALPAVAFLVVALLAVPPLAVASLAVIALHMAAALRVTGWPTVAR